MEMKSYRDYTRLLIMTFFFMSNSLIFVRRTIWGGFPPHRGPDVDISLAASILLSAAFSLWYLIEIYEFWRWNYSLGKRASGYRLFALRLVPFVVSLVIFPHYFSLLMPIMMVITVFYSAVYFRFGVGIIVLLCFLLVQIWAEFYLGDPLRPPPEHLRQTDYLFFIYRSMNTLLVWLLGFFWKRDHLRWKQNQQLNEDLQESQVQLREYADRVADTVMLEERTRLARDIHDSVGHNLTAASLQLSKSEGYFEKDPTVAKIALAEARTCIQTGIQDIREVLNTLNDDRHELYIFSQIRNLTGRLPADQYKVTLDLQGEQKDYNMAVLLAIYRMVQEGVTNILKHSGADIVRIAVKLGDDFAVASIEDNGRGFRTADTENAASFNQARSFGLQGLRDRISLVRGEFRIDTAPGRGVLLEAKIPKQPTKVIGGE
ncbi:MAG: sensor histidine kinase [Spirochaetota bacterium]|nr:sensor histidine kinase [Spirochaetota bacterium]